MTSSIKGNPIRLKQDGKDDFIKILTNLTEKDRVRFERRCAYVKEFKKLGITRGCRNQIKEQLPIIASKFNDSKPPQVPTVMFWLKKFESTGENYFVLMNKIKCAKSNLSLNEKIQEKINYLLNKHYLVLHGESVAQVYSRLMSDSEMYAFDKKSKRKGRLMYSKGKRSVIPH